jgi:hypothetical protein
MRRQTYWIPAFAGMTKTEMRLLILLSPLLLAACGQAGDLYLPDKKPAPQPAPAAQAPATTTDSPVNPTTPPQPPASDAPKQSEQKKEPPKSP